MDSSHLKTDLRELAGILKTYGGKNISSSQTSFVIRALQHKLQIFDFEMSFLESNIKKYITHEEAQNVILQYYPPIIPTQPVDTAHKLEMCYNPFTDMPFLTDEQLGGDLENRAIAPTAPQDERVLENELRPRSLADFIGQEHLKDSLSIFLQAAQQRGEPLDHVLLYGNPGLGKTTLANIIAGEMGRSCKVTSGPTLEKVGDLAAILTSLEPGDVLFIDEIHRLNRSIEEVLYPALEDFALDLMIGKGPGARSLRMQLNKFTLIGATTRPSLISSPLRDRFGATFHLDFYNDEDMQRIIKRSSGILGLPMDDSAVNKLSAATRRTPRVANRLLRRVRDVAQVEKSSTATEPIVTKTLDMLRVDHLGLDHGDRKILTTIIETFRGGPVGLSTLAAAVAEEMETLETVHEPYLLQIGFLERTPKGRCITPRALEHLGLSVAARGSVR